MKLIVEESTMIKPLEETPKHILWASNVDQLFKMHMPSVYFYRPNGSTNFFDANVLKDALRKVLVTFYPIAGRLRRDRDGRAEIACSGEGVVFVEAHADSVLEDLGDFTPSPELMKLVPSAVEYFGDKDSSPPLLLVQVTYFKCGAVSLGIAIDHTLVDGTSGIHFINSWSDIARGVHIKIPPCIDRTLLRARDPPTQLFSHIEHQPSPTMKTPIKFQSTHTSTVALMLKITREQINLLKALCKEWPSPTTYSSYEVLAAHIWRCACKARGLELDQETKLPIATDGRSRLYPPLPEGYFGNAIFHMTPIAKSGDLLKKPLLNTVQMIRETLNKANDQYIRSALDFLELHVNLIRGSNTFKCSNMAVTSWCRMPIYEADFGWGKPMFMGPGIVPYEGLDISFQAQQMMGAWFWSFLCWITWPSSKNISTTSKNEAYVFFQQF